MVIGLGNPGRTYRGTRHNVGWMVLDRLAGEKDVRWRTWRGVARTGRWGDVLLVKPMTYMNLSGEAAAALREYCRVSDGDLLVVYDDLALPLGRIRVRASGSSGGHRGMDSVIERLGTAEFARLRLGIGPVPPGLEARDFVLSRFTEAERDEAEAMVGEAARAVRLWDREGTTACMNAFNRRAGSDGPDRDGTAAPEQRSDESDA
jgi:PTH1 family peptidyl-tRNA hydrolase